MYGTPEMPFKMIPTPPCNFSLFSYNVGCIYFSFHNEIVVSQNVLARHNSLAMCQNITQECLKSSNSL